jgi:phosphoribosylaminoimidazole-succinocarboxamide synthase
MDSHFIGLQDVDKMLVKRVEIIHDRSRITPESVGFFIPLEVICRHYLAGSMMDRVKAGQVKPEDLGFSKGHLPKYGEKLPQPFIEFTTKLEPIDRQLSEAEALRISGLTEKEFKDLKKAVLRIDERIAHNAESKGLLHVDGKKEFGMNLQRELMVVDTFGTLDEDRWWEKKAYDHEGKTVELSKEMVRQHYRETGYHEKLYAARKAGLPEPPIPALPDAVTKQVTDLYVSLYERITGQKW